MTRREFILRFLPDSERLRLLGAFTKTVLFGFDTIVQIVAWLIVGLVIHIQIDAIMGWSHGIWSAILSALFIALFGMLTPNAYRRFRGFAGNNLSSSSFSILLRLERTSLVFFLVFVGALIHYRWLQDPIMGYILLGMIAIVAFSRKLDRTNGANKAIE